MSEVTPNVAKTNTEPLFITDNAIKQIKKLQSANDQMSLPLRIFVQAGGCKGLSYGLMFDDQPLEDGDVQFEKNGITFVVDSESIRYLKGATVDYEENLIGGGFKVRNPNASKTCGCGSSFKACG
ncbi:MAG: iron-sulfur cluster insertion protein ErpA [bacterium]|nr:iron-sulfur cluster insertion protein ErpA [bacterium]